MGLRVGAAARLGLDVEFRDTGNYLMWGLTVPAETLPTDLGTETLLATAYEHTADWRPALREIITGVAAASLVFLPLRTSLPADRWPAGPVTLLGDAAHAMFPAGSGTLAALRDAASCAPPCEPRPRWRTPSRNTNTRCPTTPGEPFASPTTWPNVWPSLAASLIDSRRIPRLISDRRHLSRICPGVMASAHHRFRRS